MNGFRDVRVITDTGDGADIENMQIIDTGSAVTVVQPDYAQQVSKTIVIVAHGLVVLSCGQLTAETAKAYKENLPDALRRAGVLETTESVVTGVDAPPRNGGAVDRNGTGRTVPDRGLHSERRLVFQHVFNALGFLRRCVFDLNRRLRA